MSACEVWHAQLETGRRADAEAQAGLLATNCTWTVVTQGTTFRGIAEVTAFLRSGYDAADTREAPDVREEFGTDEWGAYEYTSRGTIDAERAGQFATRLVGRNAIARTLVARFVKWRYGGKRFEIPVCFLYHVTADGLIDQVHEYVGARRIV